MPSVGQARTQAGKSAPVKEAPKQVFWESRLMLLGIHPQCLFKNEWFGCGEHIPAPPAPELEQTEKDAVGQGGLVALVEGNKSRG